MCLNGGVPPHYHFTAGYRYVVLPTPHAPSSWDANRDLRFLRMRIYSAVHKRPFVGHVELCDMYISFSIAATIYLDGWMEMNSFSLIDRRLISTPPPPIWGWEE